MLTYPLNNIEYTAEDAELFHSTRTSGIYAANSFDYSITGEDNNIVVGTGIGWIKNGEFSGKVVAQKEPISLDMGLPDSVYPRIDAIVIQFDANNNETNIVVKKGTASGMPIAPDVIRTESVYELHLYHVLRNAGALYIVPGNITDLRINNSYCGLMADSVTSIDTDAIENQVSDLINSLQESIAGVKDGSAYVFVDGSSTMSGNLRMGGNLIKNVGTPTDNGDAASKEYADTKAKIDLLWKNASVSSEFAPQTISIPTIMDYSFLLIVSAYNHSGIAYALAAISTSGYKEGYLTAGLTHADGFINDSRMINVTTSGITFGKNINWNGTKVTGPWNARNIPYLIYGIKGVNL